MPLAPSHNSISHNMVLDLGFGKKKTRAKPLDSLSHNKLTSGSALSLVKEEICILTWHKMSKGSSFVLVCSSLTNHGTLS